MPLSRREFFKRSGMLALLGAPLPGHAIAENPTTDPLWKPPEVIGRTFTITNVYAQPDEASPIIANLPPDSVISINPVDTRWYAVESGYILREAAQPILPYARPAETKGVDFYAEMIAPVSVLREWCHGSAPMVARLGFGAIMYVRDRLVDDRGNVWYGLTTVAGGVLMGWASALHYQPVMSEKQSSSSQVKVVVDSGKMQVYDQDKLIAKIPVYAPTLSIPATAIRKSQVMGVGVGHHGAPWPMVLETGQVVHGVYWHNRFGMTADDQNKQIELPVLAAKWLYSLLG